MRSVLIVGAQTSGLMTACYLKRALPAVRVTLLELPRQPDAELAVTLPPALQSELFDALGLAESEWTRACAAAPHAAHRFVNWRKPRFETPDDYFYDLLSAIPEAGDVSLYHYWLLKRLHGDPEPLEYACYKEPKLLDARLAPCFSDGSPGMAYGWHCEARLLERYLRERALKLEVKLLEGELQHVELAADGSIGALQVSGRGSFGADLFVDCSGPDGLLLRRALGEPFIDASAQLCCDTMLSCMVPQLDATEGVEPFVSAIAMTAGWVSKLPLLGRCAASYVYFSEFIRPEAAARELCWLWGLSAESTTFHSSRLETGRLRRAWVHNCVAIGSSWCRVEPLRVGSVQRDWQALRRLACYFPERPIDPRVRERFNLDLQRDFDQWLALTQLHYLSTPRRDACWSSVTAGLEPSALLQPTLESHGPSQVVDTPTPVGAGCLPGSSSYHSWHAAMGWLPRRPLPSLCYPRDAQSRAERAFTRLKQDSDRLYAVLPTNYEWLRRHYAG
jgi:tryptophan halogenase